MDGFSYPSLIVNVNCGNDFIQKEITRRLNNENKSAFYLYVIWLGSCRKRNSCCSLLWCNGSSFIQLGWMKFPERDTCVVLVSRDCMQKANGNEWCWELDCWWQRENNGQLLVLCSEQGEVASLASWWKPDGAWKWEITPIALQKNCKVSLHDRPATWPKHTGYRTLITDMQGGQYHLTRCRANCSEQKPVAPICCQCSQ